MKEHHKIKWYKMSINEKNDLIAHSGILLADVQNEGGAQFRCLKSHVTIITPARCVDDDAGEAARHDAGDW